MAKQVLLKSLSTGLTGLYPESHLEDPDLVLDEEDPDCDCWMEQQDELFSVSDEGELEPWEKELLFSDELNDKEVNDGE